MAITKIVRPEIIFKSNFYIPVSVIVPAYNESKNIIENVKSLLQLQYPEYEIIVVNDGSKDDTLEVMKHAYKMIAVSFEPGSDIATKGIRGLYVSMKYKNLILVDKENGGKADALNAGINYSKHPLFCALDADSILENKSLLKITRPFVEDPDIAAVGGIIRIVNGCQIKYGEVVSIDLPSNVLAKFQIVEYLRAFLFGRTGWSTINAMLIISGAFGLFKKSYVIDAGGYNPNTVGEDMELVVRMHRLYGRKENLKIMFIPDPVCYTEVPESLSIMSKQRGRWQRGLIDSLLLNIGMLLNPRYGAVGMIAMPFFVIFEMFGPLIEFGGYIIFLISIYLGIISYKIAFLFFMASVILGIMLSVSSILLEELTFKKYPKVSHAVMLFIYSIIENFGYKQLNTYFRFKGTIDYIMGKHGWGEMKRKGFDGVKK